MNHKRQSISHPISSDGYRPLSVVGSNNEVMAPPQEVKPPVNASLAAKIGRYLFGDVSPMSEFDLRAITLTDYGENQPTHEDVRQACSRALGGLALAVDPAVLATQPPIEETRPPITETGE